LSEQEAIVLLKKENKTFQEAIDLKKYYEKEEVKAKLSFREHKKITEDLQKLISVLITADKKKDELTEKEAKALMKKEKRTIQ
jgi:hypothetical protein